jgi:hypothetical protein
MATDDQIGRFRGILGAIIVRDELNIIGYIISGFGLIAGTEADSKVVPPIAYDAEKFPPPAANFDYAFLVQVIGVNQLIGQFFRVLAKSGREHLGVFVFFLIIDELIIVSAVENVTTFAATAHKE